MKVITTYECETCGNKSADIDVIKACESQPEPTNHGLKIGDIVTSGGYYGWWEGSEEWFHREAGDPNSTSHLERAKIGIPKFVIIDIVPYSKVSSFTGDHSLAFILFSPDYANSPDRHCIGWTAPDTHYRCDKKGEVTGQELQDLIDVSGYTNPKEVHLL